MLFRSDARTNDGTTPLIIASSNGHMAVVRELLARGADVNARDNIGGTALHEASSNGHAEAQRELLKRDGVNVNAQDNDGSTPLMDACLDGHLMAATLLIAHGANLALLDINGDSALAVAEQLVEDDEGEDGEGKEGEAEDAKRERLSARAKLHEQHRFLVATLKAHGAA